MKQTGKLYRRLFSTMLPLGFTTCLLFASNAIGQSAFPTQQTVNLLMNEAMQASDLPAVVAIAINKDGQSVAYTKGNAIWDEEGAVTTNHIFRIYSMTKLVTSIAAMQLVERNLIGLDDDLSDILPEMAAIPVIKNGVPVKGTNPVTLRQLLTHTSGFGYTFTSKALSNFDTTGWRYKDLPRQFESGTGFLYGTSLNWTGRLVEKLSGMDLETYFRKYITGPLGMSRTWFNVPDSLKQFIVSRGQRGIDGKQPLTEYPERIPTIVITKFNPGGGLFSSPADFTRLLQCLLNGGQLDGVRILSDSTVSEMTSNQIGDVTIDIADAYFGSSCCDFRGLLTLNDKWGIGWAIDNDTTTYGRKAGTVFWGGMMNSYFYIDFASGIAASIYTQYVPFNHPATTGLFNQFSGIIYSAGKHN